jgi:hypothetical protein
MDTGIEYNPFGDIKILSAADAGIKTDEPILC